MMRFLILFSFLGFDLFSQTIDISKVDNKSNLNKYESDFLNEYLKEFRDTFDFTQKRIVFVTGSSATTIVDKKTYFLTINDWNLKHQEKVSTSLFIFNSTDKEKSCGFDAIVTYWIKVKIESQKNTIIDKIKNSH